MIESRSSTYRDTGIRFGQEVQSHRVQTQQTAQQLSVVAMRQWEKATAGAFALPAALALSSAATVMHVAAALERIFELVESSVVEIGRTVEREVDGSRELARTATLDKRDNADARSPS
jgi:hypothetical protein